MKFISVYTLSKELQITPFLWVANSMFLDNVFSYLYRSATIRPKTIFLNVKPFRFTHVFWQNNYTASFFVILVISYFKELGVLLTQLLV